MIYFTSDLHFFHSNIIKLRKRPFADANEMDEALIRNWNNQVLPTDHVYILGDISMAPTYYIAEIMNRLNGKKYLVKGNHDKFVDRVDWDKYSHIFEWVKPYHEMVESTQKIVLFHYPIAEWNGFFRGALHLHGHQHNDPTYNLRQKSFGLRRYDVGVDANKFTPVSLKYILNFLKDVKENNKDYLK